MSSSYITSQKNSLPNVVRTQAIWWLSLVLALAAITAPGRAATLNVPTDYATIQAAVNAAAGGDTVLLADGTYTGVGNRDIDFGGKNLVVTSQNGPSRTIIDCNGTYTSDASGNHRGFYLHNGETNAIISGLTIENGREGSGGGYNPGGYGGAIEAFAVRVTVQNCFLNNNAVKSGIGGGGEGGAIYTGGGIYSNAGYMTVIDCTITGNAATRGGGIFNREGNGALTMTNCTITDNTAGDGGGLCSANADSGNDTVTLTNDTFTGNTANFGGGIYNTTLGGGIFTVINCTLTANTANNVGGIYYHSDKISTNGMFTLTNDIFWGEIGAEVNTNIAATVSHCDIQGGFAGTGNINADPQFVSAPTDLHLQPGSPCLGAGTSMGAPATDKDNTPRPNPPGIGAYDLVPPALSSLTFPSPVPGGTVVTATVTLSGTTPSDVVVGLSSSNSAIVRLHRGVIIPAGSSSATFAINTFRSHVSNTVTIQASLNGVVKAQDLTITGR